MCEVKNTWLLVLLVMDLFLRYVGSKSRYVLVYVLGTRNMGRVGLRDTELDILL